MDDAVFEKIANKAAAIRKDLDDLEGLIAESWAASSPQSFEMSSPEIPVNFEDALTELGVQGLCEKIIQEPSSTPKTVKFCRSIATWAEDRGRLSAAQQDALRRIWHGTYQRKGSS